MVQKPSSPRGAPVEKLVSANREARFRYELIDQFEAGIMLLGTEVKSARAGGVNLRDSHVRLKDGEAFLVGCHVNPYENAGYSQHDPLRERKLLLHAAQLLRLARAVDRSGLTIVPLRMYFKGSCVKVEIAVGRGKNLHDKRETVKQRDAERSARSAQD